MIDAHDLAREPHVLPPGLGRARLDGDAPHDRGGSTLSLYAWSWRSKVVVLGMDTRRTLRPFAAAARTASAAMPTSEPVAITITSGGPSESIST